VSRAAAALEQARARLTRARPRESARLGALAAVGLATTQAFLPPDAALLEYVVGERFAVLFVVRRDRFSVHRLAEPARIGAAVERLAGLLELPSLVGATLFRARAAEAYDLLVRPAAADLAGATTLVVSPDGPLQRLPFGVLVESAASGSSYRDLAYLARRFAVMRVPSASAAVELGRRPAAERARALSVVAFGGPTLPGATAEPAGQRSVFELGAGTLAPLPGAADEARRLAKLLPGSRALVGAEASEERVKGLAEVRSARLLHFAAHGLPSERRPELSALVLAPSAGEDGLLQAWEVVDLGLTSDLVVLSACRSALGRQLSGEGFLGLTQAFLEAGTRGVVASLWPVADRSTADLMASFYRRLARGVAPATALAEAQRELLGRGGLDAHPARWAPFVLVGGGVQPPRPDEPRDGATAR
jgi:CHAT domain-containing protein